MHLNLKQIINDLLLQESVREVDAFINQRRDEIEKETLRTFFDKFKTYSGSNPNQTLAQIDVPFFKWLFNVSVEQNPNITDQELNHFFDTSITFFNNKNKFSFNFKQNPPSWNTFETEILEKTEEQREKRTEEATLVQLLSRDINTKWIEGLGDSKVNKPEILKRFKEWQGGSLFDESNEDPEFKKENNILVVQPRTTLSAKFWGNPRCFGVDVGFGVKWCTSATQSGNMFHQYIKGTSSKLIYIIDLSKPDRDPWQKIAVLIKKNKEIEIFDATDTSYYLEKAKEKIKSVNIEKLIDKIIEKFLKQNDDQYSPTQIKNLSQEEKHTLFLTTLRDPSSEDTQYIAHHFKEFFNSSSTTEHDRKQIIKNLIGSSEYDNTLIDLIDKYLNSNNLNFDFNNIIKYLNSADKQSKAAAKFYEHKTYFSDNYRELNTEHWKLLKDYLSDEQKRKIAIKFLLKSTENEYLPANWNDLAEYLKPAERSEHAYKHIISEDLFPIRMWRNLSQYLTDQQKRNIAEKHIINNKEYGKFSILSDYLTEDEKSEIVFKMFINDNLSNDDDLIDITYWNLYSKYLNDTQKKEIAEHYLLKNKYFDENTWSLLQEFLNDTQKKQAIQNFFKKHKEFDLDLWNNLSSYLTEQEKKQKIEEYIDHMLNSASSYFDHYFSENLWKTYLIYSNQNEQNKFANEFLTRCPFWFRPAWNTLLHYLTPEQKSKFAERFLEPGLSALEKKELIKYLTPEQKLKFKTKKITESNIKKIKLKLLKLAVNNLL